MEKIREELKNYIDEYDDKIDDLISNDNVYDYIRENNFENIAELEELIDVDLKENGLDSQFLPLYIDYNEITVLDERDYYCINAYLRLERQNNGILSYSREDILKAYIDDAEKEDLEEMFYDHFYDDVKEDYEQKYEKTVLNVIDKNENCQNKHIKDLNDDFSILKCEKYLNVIRNIDEDFEHFHSREERLKEFNNFKNQDEEYNDEFFNIMWDIENKIKCLNEITFDDKPLFKKTYNEELKEELELQPLWKVG